MELAIEEGSAEGGGLLERLCVPMPGVEEHDVALIDLTRMASLGAQSKWSVVNRPRPNKERRNNSRRRDRSPDLDFRRR
jgi:hypothetical protein